jgi:hypothetical protein
VGGAGPPRQAVAVLSALLRLGLEPRDLLKPKERGHVPVAVLRLLLENSANHVLLEHP